MVFCFFHQQGLPLKRGDTDLYLRLLSYSLYPDFWEKISTFSDAPKTPLCSYKHTLKLSCLFLFHQNLSRGGVEETLFTFVIECYVSAAKVRPRRGPARHASRLISGTPARGKSLWARESLFRGVTASPSIRLTNVMAVALLTSLLSRAALRWKRYQFLQPTRLRLLQHLHALHILCPDY